eukprot:TRINITY_DN6450_c0_g1_i1.p1 TRINITY_DN6450_c0_g1~~TRINITY_DN6450_c0_g1_i1.p1  ORF type:complete len:192 (-),score=12.28 TRINITY_DN6450_c0_g1_i1:130-705(-)
MTSVTEIRHQDSVREFVATTPQASLLGRITFHVAVSAVLAALLPLWLLPLVLVSLVLVALLLELTRVQSESLMTISQFGVQITKTYAFGRQKSSFLTSASIKGLIINEGIQENRCVYYLAFVVEGRDRLVLPFEMFLPRYRDVVHIYHCTRSLLLGDDPDWEDLGGSPLNPTSPLGPFSHMTRPLMRGGAE